MWFYSVMIIKPKNYETGVESMPEYSEKKKAYNIRYQREKMKRIPLDVQFPEYELIKQAAINNGESVNGYIKKAIFSRIESESITDPPEN